MRRVLLPACALLTACFDPGLAGRPCDGPADCVEGFVCVDRQCVDPSEVPAPDDAGPDGGPPARPDAGAIDAGAADGGGPDPVDAGADGGDRPGEFDAGGFDAGDFDAGDRDAGDRDAGRDAGILDAGDGDAGVAEPLCGDLNALVDDFEDARLDDRWVISQTPGSTVGSFLGALSINLDADEVARAGVTSRHTYRVGDGARLHLELAQASDVAAATVLRMQGALASLTLAVTSTQVELRRDDGVGELVVSTVPRPPLDRGDLVLRVTGDSVVAELVEPSTQEVTPVGITPAAPLLGELVHVTVEVTNGGAAPATDPTPAIFRALNFAETSTGFCAPRDALGDSFDDDELARQWRILVSPPCSVTEATGRLNFNCAGSTNQEFAAVESNPVDLRAGNFRSSWAPPDSEASFTYHRIYLDRTFTEHIEIQERPSGILITGDLGGPGQVGFPRPPANGVELEVVGDDLVIYAVESNGTRVETLATFDVAARALDEVVFELGLGANSNILPSSVRLRRVF